MFNLNFRKLLGKNNNVDKNSHYLGLFLKETEGVGLIMVKKANRLELINWHRFKYSDGWENLSQDVDELLIKLESNLGINLTQTIFFLYSHSINGQTKEVKTTYLAMIKNLTKSLDLKPLGYIEVVDAVISWLEKKEESLVNTILVEIDSSNLCVFIIRGSKKISIQLTARTDNIASDINNIFQEKAGSIILPSRIIIYNSHDLSKDISILMSHRWDRDLFVQIPKIDLLKEEDMVESLTDLFSSQIYINSKQESKSVEVYKEKKMGFVIGGEIERKVTKSITSNGKNNFYIENLFMKLKKLKFNRFILIGLILCVFALTMIEVVLHKASLEITLPVQNIEQITKYNIKKNDPNFNKQEITFDVSQTKPTNGKKSIGEKAKGEVIIHNFDDVDKTFSKGTIILGDGKQYIIEEEVNVKPASLAVDGSAKIPGKAKVRITAVDIGSEGNLSKGQRFKFVDFPITLFFAINESSLSGGSKKEVRTVAKKDLDELENTVLEKAKTEGNGRINQTIKQGYGYIKNFVDYQLTDSKFSKEVGEEASDVNVKSKITLSFYVYNTNNLNNLAIAALKNKINKGFDLENNKTTLSVIKSEVSEGTTSIDLLIKGKAMVFVDKNKLKNQLLGKHTNITKQIINNNLHAISYTLQIEPNFVFIKDRMPWYLNNILIKVNY